MIKLIQNNLPQLNPKVDTPKFAATVAAAPLQLFQVDLVH